MLAAMCSPFGATLGTLSVIVHKLIPPPILPSQIQIDAPDISVSALQRAFHVAFEATQPAATSDVGYVESNNVDPVFQSASTGDATIAGWDDQVRQRLTAAPTVWQASEQEPTRGSSNVIRLADIARSLIPLGDQRYSLLELRRRADRPVFTALELRAIGIVHRECAWVCDASALSGTTVVPGLSPRERETLEHLLAGASEKEVAVLLHRSRHTIHSYVKRIYRQLGVRSRAELLAIFVDAAGRESRPTSA